MTDGVCFLLIINALEPGIVNWAQSVKTEIKNIYMKIENCNYAIKLVKQELKIEGMNCGSRDIVDQNKKNVLAFLWILMKEYCIRKFGVQTDDQVTDWAN
jgi:hypothetical protein